LANANKEIQELKRKIHELKDEMEDIAKENKLQNDLKNE
jgi:hypothetical protein